MVRRAKSRVLRRVFWSLVLTSVEAFLAVLAILAGLPILLDPGTLAPDSIILHFPMWMVYFWAGGLTAGGALSLTGIIAAEARIERMGAAALAATSLSYAAVLTGLLPTSFLAFLTYSLLGLAMVARYWVLGRIFTLMNKMRRDGP